MCTMCIQKWCDAVQKMEPDSSQWCSMKRQEAIPFKSNSKNHDLFTETGCSDSCEDSNLGHIIKTQLVATLSSLFLLTLF